MRRSSSTRQTGVPNSAASTAPPAIDIFRSATSKAIIKELERIDQVFYAYADPSLGMIDPEGIISLCSDIGVDHTDIRILLLAWKMKAEKQGYFTIEEWRRGLKALKAANIAKLKKAVLDIEKEVIEPQAFVDFYSYAFRYCLTEEKQKSVDIESICELLTIVLGSKYSTQVESLVEYLKVKDRRNLFFL